MKLITIPLSLVDPHPMNPRGSIDETTPRFTRLVESIKAIGVLTPPAVRPHPLVSGRYQLEAGHRRTAAARKAGLTEIPVYVAEHDDDTAFLALVAENEQHEDLTREQRNIGLQGILRLGDVELAGKAVGLDPALIRAARKGYALVDKAKLEQASLEDLAVLQEFEGTPEFAELEKLIGTPRFEWESKNIRGRIERRLRAEELLNALHTAGATEAEIDRNIHIAAEDLLTEDGDPVDQLALAGQCPAHYRDRGEWYDPRYQVFILRTEATTLGLKNRYERTVDPEEQAKREEEAAKRAEFEAHGEASREVRYEFMRHLTPLSATKLYGAIARILQVWNLEIEWSGAQALLGENVKPSTEALMAALTKATDDAVFDPFTVSWRRADDDAAELLLLWLDTLVNLGYTHTPWEAEIVNKAKAIIAEAAESRTCKSCAAGEDDCAGAGSDDPACADWRAE